MAGLFVRLRLRLLANGLKGGGYRLVGFVLAAVGGAAVGVIGFVVIAVTRGNEAAPVLVVLTFTTALIGWITLPLIGFGSNASVDPSLLVTLPLRRRELLVGLLAAAVVGAGAAMTAAAAAGAVVAFADSVAGFAVLVAAGITQVVLFVTLSRALTTSLSATLRSRRGRDLRILAVFVVFLAPQGLRFLVPSGSTEIADLEGPANAMSWIPMLWPSRAMTEVGQGHLLAGVAFVAGGLALVVGFVAWWGWAIDRILTTVDAADTSAQVRARAAGGPGDGRDPLFGLLYAWLPRTRTGAVAAREGRLGWRDPRRKVNLLSGLLLPFIILAGIVSRGGLEDPWVVYSCVVLVALSGNRVFNQLGNDGRAWSMQEAAGSDLRADLDGKSVAASVVQMPEVLVVALLLAVPSHGWAEVAPAFVFSLALSGVQLGLGNYVSVLAPFPMPTSTTNVWGNSSPGQGCIFGLIQLVALAALLLVAAPFVVAALLVPGASARLALAVLALPFGALAYWLFTRAAVAHGRDRGPELLAALWTHPTGG